MNDKEFEQKNIKDLMCLEDLFENKYITQNKLLEKMIYKKKRLWEILWFSFKQNRLNEGLRAKFFFSVKRHKNGFFLEFCQNIWKKYLTSFVLVISFWQKIFIWFTIILKKGSKKVARIKFSYFLLKFFCNWNLVKVMKSKE